MSDDQVENYQKLLSRENAQFTTNLRFQTIQLIYQACLLATFTSISENRNFQENFKNPFLFHETLSFL